MNKQIIRLVTLLAFLGVIIGQPGPVFASVSGASDVIATVNAMRKARGLNPYQVSSDLMGFAQAHSDYQASIGACTHQLANGGLPFDSGILENIACGNKLSIDAGISNYWQDAVHQSTLFGFSDGYVGAGVAVKGTYVYYTLDVKQNTTAVSVKSNPADLAAAAVATVTPGATLPPVEPLVTSTPNPDGSIVHVVGNGQSLWSIAIAYGAKIADILKNSNLPATTGVVFVGEKLMIKKGLPATVTPTITKTRPANTSTRPPTRIPGTPTPTPTETAIPTITPTATPTQWISALIPAGTGKIQMIGIGLVSACVLGLLVVGVTGFRKK